MPEIPLFSSLGQPFFVLLRSSYDLCFSWPLCVLASFFRSPNPVRRPACGLRRVSSCTRTVEEGYEAFQGVGPHTMCALSAQTSQSLRAQRHRLSPLLLHPPPRPAPLPLFTTPPRPRSRWAASTARPPPAPCRPTRPPAGASLRACRGKAPRRVEEGSRKGLGDVSEMSRRCLGDVEERSRRGQRGGRGEVEERSRPAG